MKCSSEYYKSNRKRIKNFIGYFISKAGYKLIYVGKDHHLANKGGYAFEHRLVAEKTIGRRLEKKEQIHHIDENKLNNSPENLLVTRDAAHHRSFHKKTKIINTVKRNKIVKTVKKNKIVNKVEINKYRTRKEKVLIIIKNELVICKCGCGMSLEKISEYGRCREYINHHNFKGQPIKNKIMEILSTETASAKSIHEKLPEHTHDAVRATLFKLLKHSKIRKVSRGLFSVCTEQILKNN